MNPIPYGDNDGDDNNEVDEHNEMDGTAGEAGGTETGTTQDIEVPQGPVGPDFTKPLRTKVGRQPVKVLTVSAGNTDFPVVCLVKIGGAEVPMSYSLMGEDPELGHVIENIPPIPSTAIGRVLRSVIDDSLCFDNKVFATETEARDAVVDGFEFISSYKVVLPQVNEAGEQEEIEEPTDGVQEMRVGSRTLKVGDEITVNRRRIGYRPCTIVKFRDQPGKNCFVQPTNGSAPYWCFNSSIR